MINRIRAWAGVQVADRNELGLFDVYVDGVLHQSNLSEREVLHDLLLSASTLHTALEEKVHNSRKGGLSR